MPESGRRDFHPHLSKSSTLNGSNLLPGWWSYLRTLPTVIHPQRIAPFLQLKNISLGFCPVDLSPSLGLYF
ncbi:MAG: hypothetical protein DSM106950_13585 [Stigonema ocellatum SAG 48.90 = DSM 106950]|nr:hypothetical protein [Stigonema ocellatum SAG 48.90 = DSM 106950]